MRLVTISLLMLLLVFPDNTDYFEQLFNTRIDYETNEGSAAVFASDLNGDNYLDLAVANAGSHDISIMLNNGDGTYQTAVNYPTGGSEPWSVFAADFDGDGLQDFVMQTDDNALSFFRGEPTGRLFADDAVTRRVPLPRNGELVAADDINGDRLADLVIRYNAADGKAAARTVRLLIAKP